MSKYAAELSPYVSDQEIESEEDEEEQEEEKVDPESAQDYEIMKTLTSLTTRSLSMKLPSSTASTVSTPAPASASVSTSSALFSPSSSSSSYLYTPPTLEKKENPQNFLSHGFSGTSPTDYLFYNSQPLSSSAITEENQFSPSFLYNLKVSPLNLEELRPKSVLKTEENLKKKVKKEVHFDLSPSPLSPSPAPPTFSSQISTSSYFTPSPPSPPHSGDSFDEIDHLSTHLYEALGRDSLSHISPSRISISSDSSSSSSSSPLPLSSLSSPLPSTPSLHPFKSPQGLRPKENISLNFNPQSALLAHLKEKSKYKNILENPYEMREN